MRNQARAEVEELRESLANVDKLDMEKLLAIQAFIQQANMEISEADTLTLYQGLRMELTNQQSRRQDLEEELSTLREEVSYLRHINSILPQDCDSNL